MLMKLEPHIVKEVVADDPVRPHIPAEWRTTGGREVYGLFEDESAEILRAVICVAYTNEVPTNESEMDRRGTDVAVFYTVWSYDRGAGRDIVLSVAEHIKNTTFVKRFVTLSPLTEMAERFHLRNGAELIGKYDECQNFEYTV